jgi:hypothetical protein
MDRITLQRDAVQAILNDYHRLNQQTTGTIESMVITDHEQDQYLLILSGWNGTRRIRNIFFHIRLKQGKVWIEEDWSEEGFANEIMQRGIERSEIVLGFQPPQVREFTEFAAVLA